MSRLVTRRRILPRPSLTVSVSDPLVSVLQGESVSLTVTVVRSSLALDVPTVVVVGLPAGVTATVGSPDGTSRLRTTYAVTLEANSAAVPVNAVSFQATATSGATQGAAVSSLTVVQAAPAPGSQFVLSVTGPVVVARGSATDVPVRVVRATGYTAEITLSIDETLPSGVTTAFLPNPLTGDTGVLRLTAASEAALEQSTITVRAAGPGSTDSTRPLTFSVVGAGSYARLAPLYLLPRDANGVPLTYDSSTGGTTRDVYRPAEADYSPWWLDQLTTIRRVRESGGDYTPAQLQSAIAAALADTTQSYTLVVDTGVAIGRSLNDDVGVIEIADRAAGSTRWLHIVPSDWYDATWTPSADAHFDHVDDWQHCFVAQNTRVPTGGAQGSPVLRIRTSNVRVLGLAARRPNAFGDFSVLRPMAHITGTASNVVLAHCAFDGQSQAGNYNYQVGIRNDGTNVFIRNTASFGFSRAGAESTALYSATGKQHQYHWCFIESASINYFTGGLWMPTPDGISDVLFRKCYFPKRQAFNPASHLYVPTTAKQNFELKYGTRYLMEDCVFENSFRSGTEGNGIALSVTNQDPTFDTRPGYVYEVSNITFLNCVVRGVAVGARTDGYPERVNTKPMHNLDFVNTLFVIAPGYQVNSTLNQSNTRHGYGFSTGKRAGTGTFAYQNHADLYGNVKFRWVTVATTKPASEAMLRGLFSTQWTDFASYDEGNAVENCVIADSTGHVNNLATTDATFNRVDALRRSKLNFRRTAIVVQAPATVNATRLVMDQAQFAAHAAEFPDQQDPGLFVASRDALFTNPTAFDFSLKADCTAKGKGDGGYDPGYDRTLVAARTAGVRYLPPALQIEWVEAP